MSYPKSCEKCNQFEQWCFCEPADAPAVTPATEEKIPDHWDFNRVSEYILHPDGSIEKVFKKDMSAFVPELWAHELLHQMLLASGRML